MKIEFLKLLQCPRCQAGLDVTVEEKNDVEVRRGKLTCSGVVPHSYEIVDGILRFAAGFDHEAVKKELQDQNTTYVGSDKLRDPKLIANFPDTLTELWPHVRHFGPDFRHLIEKLAINKGDWVLDIGTGPCWSSRLLAQTGANVIALDVNEADFYGLKTSDILFAEHGVFFERILESMTHLPLLSESMRAITFNAAFHHTPDMEKSLEECWRVLKPGGKVAMVNEEFASIRQRIQPAGETTDHGSHHTIGYGEFDEALKRIGFRADNRVADHVRTALESKLSPSIGRAAVGTFESWPFLLKQLRSALIILHKDGAASKRKTPIAKRETERVG